jgi:dihydroorotate dehydrogenase (fumarate)
MKPVYEDNFSPPKAKKVACFAKYFIFTETFEKAYQFYTKMINLETSYMGLSLRNPLIAGSSGMTNSVENIIELEKNGIGAVVLKSLFEEQIHHTASHTLMQGEYANLYPEAEDYIRNYTAENDVNNYLQLIEKAKSAVSVPIIASINCISDSEWIDYAKKIEAAGADGLELNIAVLPSDVHKDSSQNEKIYFDIARKITETLKIPVAIKLSYYFSGLAKTITSLSWTGIKALVLFNRFYSPDIDIEHEEIKSSFVFSTPAEIALPLRWIAMLSPSVKCDLAASTGVHDGAAVIKQLLAGATAVQIASVLYKKGFKEVESMIDQIESWMDRHSYRYIDEFRGKLSVAETENAAAYERIQFMKHFSGIE